MKKTKKHNTKSASDTNSLLKSVAIATMIGVVAWLAAMLVLCTLANQSSDPKVLTLPLGLSCTAFSCIVCGVTCAKLELGRHVGVGALSGFALFALTTALGAFVGGGKVNASYSAMTLLGMVLVCMLSSALSGRPKSKVKRAFKR